MKFTKNVNSIKTFCWSFADYSDRKIIKGIANRIGLCLDYIET
jgi:hypothetical protein